MLALMLMITPPVCWSRMTRSCRLNCPKLQAAPSGDWTGSGTSRQLLGLYPPYLVCHAAGDMVLASRFLQGAMRMVRVNSSGDELDA